MDMPNTESKKMYCKYLKSFILPNKQIINNLKLPELDKEKEEIKNKIVQESNSENQRVLLTRYDEIIKEIKFIRNKELE